MAMRVLGIDPGLTRCGVGIVDGTVGRPPIFVAVGVVRTDPALDVARRLAEIAAGLDEWFDEYTPEAVAIERVFAQHNLGSVIDTAALAQALRAGTVAGAGLDVYESEPAPSAELLALDNVVLTPHVAGWSPEAVQASVDRFVENARRHFAGEVPVSPV